MESSWIDLSNIEKPLKFNQFKVNFNPVLFNAKPLPKHIQRQLDDRWNNLLENRSSDKVLFNQSKFRLHSLHREVNDVDGSLELTLNLGLTDYKSFICTQQDLSDELRQHITEDHLAHPLGVACILITSDNCIVLIKRSAACADAPNIYDIPGGHAEPKNVKEYTDENIIREITSAAIAECISETNVDRESLLIDTSFYVVTLMRSRKHYNRPVFEFCLRTTRTSDELQHLYDLQTQTEAFETTSIKFWPIEKISELLDASNVSIPLNPACHAALTAYIRIFS